MQQKRSPDGAVVGILLAAGRGARFDPTGTRNKLLQACAHGDAVVTASAGNLLSVLPSVLAVVRPGADDVASRLRALGCEVTPCQNADLGMAASLVHALSCVSHARGWIIALGDMPYVQPATIRALAAAVEGGAHIAAPTYLRRRGNPVAFSRAHLPELLALRGDEGARRLLNAYPVTEIAVDDPGICMDVDTPEDLDSKH